jgi:putative flavoprotein involved in K+ transport
MKATTQTLVIGAGQAGLSLSRYLTLAGHDHVVLERGRMGERWRSERWDSLTLLTPNWLNRLDGSPPHAEPDGFLGREAFVDYLESYARSFAAPVHEGVSVLSVGRAAGGFGVETDAGAWLARNVVIATGDSDIPAIPPVAASVPPGILQLPTSRYASPAALPPGGVLVVGAGPSGQQVALELRRAGREVVLAVGRHARIPRRYRDRDVWYWLSVLGLLDQTIDEAADEEASRRAPSLPLSGARGGEQLDLAVLSEAGVVIAGRLEGFDGPRALFADDLAFTTGEAERRLRRLLTNIDSHIATVAGARGMPDAEEITEVKLPAAPRMLDLGVAGVSTVLWATGYRRAYPWLDVPGMLGADGEIRHKRGVTPAPGLYVLGLRFQHRRQSHFIGGIGEEACFLTARILDAPRRCRRPLRGFHGAPASSASRIATVRAPSPRRSRPNASSIPSRSVKCETVLATSKRPSATRPASSAISWAGLPEP